MSFVILSLVTRFFPFQVLGMTVKESIHELGMFAFFLAVVVLIFSSSIYVVEMEEEDNQFSSIPGEPTGYSIHVGTFMDSVQFNLIQFLDQFCR